MSEPITFTAYAVNNLCYKANCKMPAGSPAVDLRPTMATITDIRQRSDGNYAYSAEL